VDTGWAPRAGRTASDILTLWGLHDSLVTDFSVPATATAAPSGYQFQLKGDRTDTYVLSLSYQSNGISAQRLTSGLFGLATRDAEGNRVNAVAANDGGDGSFVQGPYVHGDTLGTYGIDTATQTAWAVVNHQGDFAVADFAKGSPQLYALISSKAGPAGARVWTLKLVNGHEPVRGARIDDLTLTQTRGTACTNRTGGIREPADSRRLHRRGAARCRRPPGRGRADAGRGLGRARSVAAHRARPVERRGHHLPGHDVAAGDPGRRGDGRALHRPRHRCAGIELGRGWVGGGVSSAVLQGQ
jgi:hypothetical protein